MTPEEIEKTVRRMVHFGAPKAALLGEVVLLCKLQFDGIFKDILLSIIVFQNFGKIDFKKQGQQKCMFLLMV